MQTIKEKVLKSMGNKTIRYSLLENTYGDGTTYGIGVSEKSKNNGSLEERIENISDSKEFVINLINYLSENAIDTAHFKNIVDDYMPEDNID